MSVINKVYETNGPEETMRTGRIFRENLPPRARSMPWSEIWESAKRSSPKEVCRGIGD